MLPCCHQSPAAAGPHEWAPGLHNLIACMTKSSVLPQVPDALCSGRLRMQGLADAQPTLSGYSPDVSLF